MTDLLLLGLALIVVMAGIFVVVMAGVLSIVLLGEKLIGAFLRLFMTEYRDPTWPTWLTDIAPNAIWEYDDVNRRTGIKRRERHTAKHTTRKVDSG